MATKRRPARGNRKRKTRSRSRRRSLGWGKVLAGLAIAGGVVAVGVGISRAASAEPTDGTKPAPALPPGATAPKQPIYVPPAAGAISPQTYTVQAGDSLSGIAKQLWQGQVSYNAEELWLLLWSANEQQLPDPNLIQAGMVLNVPDFNSFTAAEIAKARANYKNWRAYGPT